MFKHIYTFFHRHYHHHYHGVYKNPKKLFIFDLFLLFIAIAMLGSSLFFFFWKPGTTDLIDLKISLGDTRIKSGEAVHLTVNYTNRSKFSLNHPTLSVHLPDGFIVDRNKTPENVFSNNSIINLGTVEPGAKGQAEIYGTLWAEPRSDERIVATLSYQADGQSTTEQKFASFFATLPESILVDTLTLATSTFPRQSIPFTYTLKNTGTTEITNISIEDTWSPPMIGETDRKNITLKPGETKLVTGTLTAPLKAGDYTVVIRSHIIANNQNITQSTQQKMLSVIVPNVHSEIKTTKQLSFIEPGQEIPLQLIWKSVTDFPLQQLRFKITPTEGIVDLAKTARENQLKVEGGSLIIDSSRRTALGSVTEGSADTVDITLYLLKTFKTNAGTTRFTITPSLEGTSQSIAGQIFSQDGDPVSFPLATDVTLRTEVRYYTAEGDQLGRGPLPPEVGMPTKYWAFVEVFNTINAVQNTALTITLAPGAMFTGKQSVTLGSPLSPSGDGRTLNWQYREIPPNSKTGWYFEVQVTPTDAQIGKNVGLINEISFSALDNTVNKQFNLSTGFINNILKANDRGSRSGAKVTTP